MPISSFDERFMLAALRLSRWGIGLTSTNPSVACLIVNNGIIVGRGVTACGGRPHAETKAIEEAGDRSMGATAYVTLEPCAHYGKSPPCAKSIIKSGIIRVVFCVSDPDIRVSGRGLSLLLQHGIIVDKILEKEGEKSLVTYLTRQVKKRSHVTLKLALSQDNMMGVIGQGNVAITGSVSIAQSHLLRAQSDAILVGIGTVLSDNPELTCRLNGLNDRSPTRIILDPHLKLSMDSKIVCTSYFAPVIVVADTDTSPAANSLKKRNVTIIRCNCYDIEQLLSILAVLNITSLLVEGGMAVAYSFIKSKLVDSIIIYQSNIIIGNKGLPSPIEFSEIEDSYFCNRLNYFGNDVCFEYLRKD
ncbi:bifunctional diaminohydroxyphosphoribosylaminopyrimidine deaminase/5-amino-6-(5-phosphoribosylamino)uracil reductase RibD [Candidatus Liberibacter americanus]|uniref:Riboflavin biosynthesis protein RibD n=1 Tax=Candidatus Liberibacter americanus str. Sao Paulo TaxID=1261131 RepID=U6B478_9HYPH|nr:bifunctional diaminohydroxyphosphoribosylaminopyrimidine deaminase/5-amino-6-(5-phosphoribosylamino)uracil reductase RibD [Candidatus Liberibacter americanus]AHA27700.1 Pyrimidine deaminase [Candidatus Liberibacter americanus str. Sao Paulo]EMS36407.1 5-amino-6-(5-phosphoribosylamino)uracil reductase [Candidatus Liberibacter americanus PW_SP]